MILLMAMFILGSAFGGIAVVINDYIVEIRTGKLERENRRLQAKIHRDRVEYEKDRAYRLGWHNATRKADESKKQKG